ncbi:MAG: hypothetical protein HWE27_02830 [Gammaproteobacteria bacterium]|nr:hypothetical protein [Gammaproteobacteria bacterium]
MKYMSINRSENSESCPASMKAINKRAANKVAANKVAANKVANYGSALQLLKYLHLSALIKQFQTLLRNCSPGKTQIKTDGDVSIFDENYTRSCC